MNHKAVSKIAMFMVAGTVSACNSTDSHYRQGPWGHSPVPRSYPEYSAPWGQRPAVPVSMVAVQPVHEPPYGMEVPLQPPRRTFDVRLEPEPPPRRLPNDFTLEAGTGLAPLSAPSSEQPARAQREASADVQASAPGVFTPPQRASSYAGMWKANVGSSSCRIQLSSVPSLDLYKASSHGCSSNVLKSVNGWSVRDGQVILFARDQVVARLSGAEAALSGTLSGSEGELTMTR